ncbi:MAG: 30S ribosomal protein S17 [Candidatus Methanomethylophilaceae archaeon]|jgi:small subunit ribosomal protein S17|nr:30S ribosomal protein S17 [Candidatus Methanomethylophilaceae archaeon]NCA73711.1 30S ribosomal protein S17 [Gammaproteobacteria bacterium]MDD2936390.1 30S ribosomal protein S17 [Candidatus Methanomethylophilaceae archaeon]MDD3351354.1 30S ribosomal protein S17 [Candidatus Methanomethylophilaceae archaeon]MDD3986726.1 30S ribosomal protein S17 [Candidatus Methanomethylophilaceae archaeon]
MTARNIGIDVKAPEAECADPDCPFHGSLPVRGQIIDGVIASVKMDKTAVVERTLTRYDQKYERYEKRTKRYSAHLAPCMAVKVGDKVTIMECRPISKTVSYAVIAKKE